MFTVTPGLQLEVPTRWSPQLELKATPSRMLKRWKLETTHWPGTTSLAPTSLSPNRVLCWTLAPCCDSFTSWCCSWGNVSSSLTLTFSDHKLTGDMESVDRFFLRLVWCQVCGRTLCPTAAGIALVYGSKFFAARRSFSKAFFQSCRILCFGRICTSSCCIAFQLHCYWW